MSSGSKLIIDLPGMSPLRYSFWLTNPEQRTKFDPLIKGMKKYSNLLFVRAVGRNDTSWTNKEW
jgi:hypothetical protein